MDGKGNRKSNTPQAAGEASKEEKESDYWHCKKKETQHNEVKMKRSRGVHNDKETSKSAHECNFNDSEQHTELDLSLRTKEALRHSDEETGHSSDIWNDDLNENLKSKNENNHGYENSRNGGEELRNGIFEKEKAASEGFDSVGLSSSKPPQTKDASLKNNCKANNNSFNRVNCQSQEESDKDDEKDEEDEEDEDQAENNNGQEKVYSA